MKIKHLYLIVLAFLLNKIHSQTTASKEVTKFIIATPQLDTLKTIWVYLPTNYKNSEKEYPVIYMHDAQNLFDAETAYAGEWKVDEHMNTLVDNQSIIIGIAHGNEKRIDELTPYKHDKYGGGQGDAYLTFIKNTLKPHIDATYRTKTDAAHTTIFGSSLGGLISFYAVLKYPEIFGQAGVFSPAFWINPEIFDVVKSAQIPETSKFYFLAGTDEGETMIPKLEDMLELLSSKGLKENQIESHIIEGGQHNEKFWVEHFGKAYDWLQKKLF
ncbi:alpha/beta hydrolase [Winogradskyella eckloniae]|uniref:alpha/beta hydrolase n=1 Tax=Winogradskyella eckloniae TaxID=1089306 RepID=UPI00156621AE|nr:alpha/beta hydrolase-fold protein [Winogradskyella eckloniae]NRD19620.1 alpha/beta hydrolase [Winogradskyella eckloniae]